MSSFLLFAYLNESAEILIVGASADFLDDLEEFAPWALAITTAKYGRKIAPEAKRTVSHPSGTITAKTTQITLIIMATVYFMKRDLRSSSGETSSEVTD
jgi:hypothetical protein